MNWFPKHRRRWRLSPIPVKWDEFSLIGKIKFWIWLKRCEYRIHKAMSRM